ncbi:hypothetical protein C8R44DRAFT_781552, partial [Mycena epipterygia]
MLHIKRHVSDFGPPQLLVPTRRLGSPESAILPVPLPSQAFFFSPSHCFYVY